METQRVEAIRQRRTNETERRNLQQRTAKATKIYTHQKVVARQITKQFLKMFKNNSLRSLEEQGLLRRPFTLGLHTDFLPRLLRQVEFDLNRKLLEVEQIDNFLSQSLRDKSELHKEAIKVEYKRRAEKKRVQEEARKKAAEDKAERKRVRAELREKARIALFFHNVNTLTLAAQELHDYTPALKVYDVRDPHGGKDGIHVIGGFPGELIITFTCLLDYILANPAN